MGSSPPPRMILSYSILAPLRMLRKIFLPHPRPLGPYETLPHLVKLYILLICPQLLQLFLIKHILLIKIYLKLKINLSHKIKLSFQEKLNNIIKVFNKTISQQKQKTQNTKSMIQQYINLFIIKTKENIKIGTLFPTLLEKKKKGKKPC